MFEFVYPQSSLLLYPHLPLYYSPSVQRLSETMYIDYVIWIVYITTSLVHSLTETMYINIPFVHRLTETMYINILFVNRLTETMFILFVHR